MTRAMTPQQSQPMGSTNMVRVPHDKVAQRAYEKWCKRGCQHGNHQQDWLDAEAELRAEMSRSPGSTQQGHRR